MASLRGSTVTVRLIGNSLKTNTLEKTTGIGCTILDGVEQEYSIYDNILCVLCVRKKECIEWLPRSTI